MIINVTYGNAESIGPYIQGPAKEHGRNVPGTEDRARIIEDHGFGFPIHTQDDVDLARAVMRQDLELQHSNTKPITNTGIHSSMSWPPGYEPTREEMRQAVDGLAKAWGMEAARRITWHHDDKTAKDPETGKEIGRHHIHTLWDPVHPVTGRAYHDHERNDRAQRAAIDFERKYGIPPTRQKDHDRAAAAEASDHARTMDLSRNTDGSILRRSLDRALALGGHFGPAKTAQRNEFIKQNDLTKFPQHSEHAYAPPAVAREKRDYIRDNCEAASTLARAYDREAKERARGVAGLYEDYSFEKTSKPPSQEERERDMGRINDALDWPWKKIGVKKFTDRVQDWRDERRYRGVEVQRHEGTTVYPDWFNKKEIERHKDYEKRSAARNRDFGKDVEEKGWDHPEVKRQWEKQWGDVQREEKRESAQSTEDQRLKNWRTQRERSGDPTRANETPPWRDDVERPKREKQHGPDSRGQPERQAEPRTDPHRASGLDRITDAHLRAKELEEAWKKDREKEPGHPEPGEIAGEIARRWSREPDPRQPWRDKVPPPIPLDREGRERIAREMGKQSGVKMPEPETPALPRPREVPMPKIEPHNHAPQAGEERFYNPFSFTKRLGEIAEEKLAKEASMREREGKAERRFQDGIDKAKDTRTPQQIEQDEHGMIGKKIPDNSQEIENRQRQRAADFRAEERREDWVLPRLRDSHNQNDIARKQQREQDGAVGEGRRDDTEAGKPGLLPGGSHELGSPSEQFRRQLDESLGKVKLPEQEIGKDQERER